MITAKREYKFEKSNDGYEILRVKENEKWVYIGSKYNMTKSIYEFLEVNKLNEGEECKIFFVFGFGTGEHIKQLREKYSNNIIIVFEPNELLKEYIEKLDWVIHDMKMVILCCDEEELKDYIENKIEMHNIHNIKVSEFNNYSKVYKREFEDFIKIVSNKIVAMEISINTIHSNEVRWFEALVNNLKYIIDGTPAEMYRDEYKNKPAVIVSAGPSLDNNIDELKEFDKKAVIITGGRTLKPLIDRNINISLLGAVDADIESFDILKDSIDKCTVPLLFYDSTNEEIVSHHKGDKIFFGNTKIVDKIAEKKMKNYCWGGSIAHVLTVYAAVLGCNPIIFVGQDLAYTNEQYYSKSSAHHSIRNTEMSKDDLFVEAVGGGVVRTEPVLNSFRVSFEEIIQAMPEHTFINATEGGAKINGSIEMTLKEVIEKYSDGEDIKPISKKVYEVDMKKNCEELINKSCKSLKLIERKCGEALKYLKYIEKYYKEKNIDKVNYFISKLDIIDKEIKNNYENIDIIENLIKTLAYNFISSYDDLNNKSDEEKSDRIIYNNKNFYELLLKRAKYAVEYIEKVFYNNNEEEDKENERRTI